MSFSRLGGVRQPTISTRHCWLKPWNLVGAVDLALRAMASASVARERNQVFGQVSLIAQELSGNAPEKCERLYHQLLALLNTWSVDDVAPLIQAQEQYARFLIG